MAAIQYKIPERHITGFNLLVGLSRDSRKALLESILNVNVGELPEEIAESKSGTLGIDRDSFVQILVSLSGLLFIKEEVYQNIEEFVVGIIEAYSRQAKRIDFDKNELSDFFTKFITGSKNLKTTLKANNLNFEREKIARRFRLLTDIRPVFDDDDGNTVKGSVITHNLNIDYLENGKSKRIVIAVDKNDLEQLKKHLQRAINKQLVLEELLKTGELKNIDLK